LVLAREHLARAAEAGLHLIDDQQDVVRAADALRGGQVAFRWHHDAGLTLDRLDQERRRIRRDRALECLGIAEGDGAKAAVERSEMVAVLRLAREADDGRGASM